MPDATQREKRNREAEPIVIEIWTSAEALDAWRANARPPRTGIKPAEIQVQRYNAEDGGPLF